MRRDLAHLVVVGIVSCQSHPPTASAPPAAAGGQPSSASTAERGSCVDSDEHTPDPGYVVGSVTVVSKTGTATTIGDACEGVKYVREGRCPDEPTEVDAQLGYYSLAYCPNGCRDGACLH